MSADYWNSTQRLKWQFTRQSLLEARRKVLLLERKMIQNGLIKEYPNINYDYNMRIYLHNLLIKLGRRLNIRQVALSTAEIYLNRFLTRVSLKEINVYLLITACLYVACKIEECPQHIRLILSESRTLWPEYIPHDITKLAEFEFYLIEEMDSYLFLHHPYKSLIQLKEFLWENNMIYGFTLSDNELQNAWSLINDSYLTDLHLLVPPHIIAVAAIYITIVLKKNLSTLRGGGSSSGNGSSGSNTITQDVRSNDTTSINTDGRNNNNNNNNNNTTDNGDSMHIDDLMILANPKDGTDGDSNVSSSITSNNINPSNTTTITTTTTNGNNNENSSTTNNTDNTNTNNNNTSQGIDNPDFQDQKLDEETIKINKFMNFLNHSHINLDEVVEAMQDMINIYVLWNRYNEQSVKKALQFMLLNR